MISQRIATATLAGTLGAAASLLAPTAAHAQLPTPRGLVSGLDLECYQTPGPALNVELELTHLNPVLRALGLPAHHVVIRELAQTCIPVRKVGGAIGDVALQFIRHIDFACYRIDAAPLANPLPINLTHLNPVLANLPQHQVTLEQPVQLCLPMGKNGILPPPEVLPLVRLIDLECYRTDPQPHQAFTVGLIQLNPQLAQIAPHPMTLGGAPPRQLCVPVQKGNQDIPDAIRDRVKWIDLEKFAAVQPVPIMPVTVQLDHLNPMFVDRPSVKVELIQASSLMVPVANNGHLPGD